MRVVGHEEAEFLDTRRRAGPFLEIEQHGERDTLALRRFRHPSGSPGDVVSDGGARSARPLIPAIRPGGASVMEAKTLTDWLTGSTRAPSRETCAVTSSANSSTRNVKTWPGLSQISHC